MLFFAGSVLTFKGFVCVNLVLCAADFGCGLKPLLSGEINNGRQLYDFQSLDY